VPQNRPYFTLFNWSFTKHPIISRYMFQPIRTECRGSVSSTPSCSGTSVFDSRHRLRVSGSSIVVSPVPHGEYWNDLSTSNRTQPFPFTFFRNSQ
jgi:hypothetical protein